MHIDPNHVPKDGPTYRPRKAPGQAELKKEVRKASFLKPWKVLQDLQEFGKQSDNVGKELLDRTRAVGEMLSTSMGMKRAESPLNGESSARVRKPKRARWAMKSPSGQCRCPCTRLPRKSS
jgi:hypothetical protein